MKTKYDIGDTILVPVKVNKIRIDRAGEVIYLARYRESSTDYFDYYFKESSVKGKLDE